ncbi:MAG: asparaginase, partial [Lachnospiraceae bacterium]|nr:asparaginase [Lachnospiraceae bacterium]
MKDILVVLTGGTIGSRVEGQWVDVNDTSPYGLIELYRNTYGEDVHFQVVQPFSILSENMRLQTWEKLCRFLWDIAYEKYEGVILAHGSDTLSYTSALLGMLLAHVPVPLVLTASNYPLGEEGSNGLVNFRSAVELIRTRLLKGVFTVYQNDKGENNVYLAARVTEADPYLDQFGSFGGQVFGKMENGNFKRNDHRINPSILQIMEKKERIAVRCPGFEKQVLMIRPYPGLDYDAIDLGKKPAAVLHYLYHSATACTQGGAYSAVNFVKRCQREGVPVYMASCKDARGRNYVT